MRFTITGATGLLGGNLTRLLLEAGHEVRVAVRVGSDRRGIEGLSIEVLEGDLNDAQFARSLVHDCDGLFHAAAVIWFGRTRKEESHRVNVLASLCLAEACIEQGCRMLFVSSVDALAAGTKDSPANETDLEPAKGETSYVISKRAAERALLELHLKSNLDLVIANPGLMLGPFDWKPSTGRMILLVTDRYMLLAPRGGVTVADVRQVGKGLIAAMQKGRAGERYIFGGTNITYFELWRRMAALAGRKGPLGRLGPAQRFVVGQVADLMAKMKGTEFEVNSLGIKLASKFNYYDSSKAIDELGYEPGSLDEALQECWQWLLNNGYSRHSEQKQQ